MGKEDLLSGLDGEQERLLRIHRLLTKPQLAEYLRVSCRKLELMMARGQLPHVRIGRSVRFDLTEVLASLKSH